MIIAGKRFGICRAFLFYNSGMKTQKEIWEAFREGIFEAENAACECLSDETEETLFFAFMSLCETVVLKKLDLTPEETEKILSVKTSQIYKRQGHFLTVEDCRKLPVNSGSFYRLIVEQLLDTQADLKRITALTAYQEALYSVLQTDLQFAGTDNHSIEE